MNELRIARASISCRSLTSRSLLVLTLSALAATLAGCGGGGGGGEGSSGGSTGGGGGSTGGGGGSTGGGGQTGITVSPTTLSFTSNHDDPNPPPSQTVTVTAHEPGSTWVMFEGGSSNGISCNNTTSCTVQVGPSSGGTSFLNPGTATYSVTLLGCADQFCVSAGQRGRATITYTYTITPGFTISPETVPTVFGVERVQTPPLLLTLTNPSGTVQPLYVLNPNLGNPVFATVTPPSGPVPSGTALEVRFANNLPVGNYTAQLEVQSGASGRFVRRRINYVVGSVFQLSGNFGFLVDGATTSEALQKTVHVGSGAPGTHFQWTATETAPWLTLSRETGDTDTQNDIVLSLVPSALEHVPTGLHRATVTISGPSFMPPALPPPGPIPTPLTFDVLLDMRLPLVEFAMPKVVVAGAAGDVYIKGSGLNGLPGTVSFGGTGATSVTRESDTRARAGYPASLAAGTYAIDLAMPANLLGLDRQHATLVVVSSGSAPPADFASTGVKYMALYDDERRTLYVADTENGEIERYVLSGTWSVGTPVPLAGLRDLTLAPGGELFALTSNTLVTVDPVALTTSSVAVPTNGGLVPHRTLGGGFDGEILIGASTEISMYSSMLRYVPFAESFAELFQCCTVGRYIRSSGDGSTVYLTINFGTDGSSVYRYVVRTRQMEGVPPAGTPGRRGLSVTRDGALFLLDATSVYTSALTVLGELSAPEALSAGVIAADGRRAYAYSSSPAQAPGARLYGFDLTASNGAGFSPLAGSPFALPTEVGAEPVMAISVDGRTVFIAGSSRVIAQPVP